MKNKIVELRERGFTYKQICEELGITKGTVSYHVGNGVKEKVSERRKATITNIRICKKINGFKKGGRTKTQEKKVIDNYDFKDVMKKIGTDPICYISGRKLDLDNTSSWHLDHMIPICKGGSSELDNMGICRKEANMMKGELLLNELIDLCIDVLKHNGYSVSL